LYVGATTEDKAFERDQTNDLGAEEFPGWNMLEFLTVRQESELVAAPAPNFRAPNLLTPERWYNPCANDGPTEQPELFSKVPTCFTAYLWDGVRGGVSLGSNPAFAEEQSAQTAMAKFHTTVPVDSMVSFVAKLDSSFPFVMLTQVRRPSARCPSDRLLVAAASPGGGELSRRLEPSPNVVSLSRLRLSASLASLHSIDQAAEWVFAPSRQSTGPARSHARSPFAPAGQMVRRGTATLLALRRRRGVLHCRRRATTRT
jgi:hypothetical protein